MSYNVNCTLAAKCLNQTTFDLMPKLMPYIGKYSLNMSFVANRAIGISIPVFVTLTSGAINLRHYTKWKHPDELPLLKPYDNGLIAPFRKFDIIVALVHAVAIILELAILIPTTIFKTPYSVARSFEQEVFKAAKSGYCLQGAFGNQTMAYYNALLSKTKSETITNIDSSSNTIGQAMGATAVFFPIVLGVVSLLCMLNQARFSKRDMLNLALLTACFAFGIFEWARANSLSLAHTLNTQWNNCTAP